MTDDLDQRAVLQIARRDGRSRLATGLPPCFGIQREPASVLMLPRVALKAAKLQERKYLRAKEAIPLVRRFPTDSHHRDGERQKSTNTKSHVCKIATR